MRYVRHVAWEIHQVTPRVSLRYLRFTACDLYFQNDFVFDKEAQSCPMYFARHPARSFTQDP